MAALIAAKELTVTEVVKDESGAEGSEAKATTAAAAGAAGAAAALLFGGGSSLAGEEAPPGVVTALAEIDGLLQVWDLDDC